MDAAAGPGAEYAKQTRTALRAILVLLSLAALYLARDFLLPVVLAIFIALTLKPAVRFLAARRIPPWLTAISFALMLIAAAAAAIYFMSGPIASWIDDAPALARNFAQKFRNLRLSLEAVSDLTVELEKASGANAGTAQEVVVRQPALFNLFNLMAGYPIQLLITVLATLVITVFLLASGDMFYEKLIRVLPSLTDKKLALRIVYNVEKDVSTYVLALTGINAALGLAVAIAFYWLGMPLAYLWGLLTFFFNFVPYVGSVSVAILSAFMAIVTFDSLSYALLIPLVFAGLSLLESEALTPLIMGHRLQLNAVALLLVGAFGAWIWGVAGAALAVPILVVVNVLCAHLEGLSGLGEFLAARQPTSNGAAQEKNT